MIFYKKQIVVNDGLVKNHKCQKNAKSVLTNKGKSGIIQMLGNANCKMRSVKEKL